MCHRKKQTSKDLKELYDLTEEPVVSSGDMTGAIQAPPADESEAESYAEITAAPISDNIPHPDKK